MVFVILTVATKALKMAKMSEKAGTVVRNKPTGKRTTIGLALGFWMGCATGLSTGAVVRAQTPLPASAAQAAGQSSKRKAELRRENREAAKERAAEAERLSAAASVNTERPAKVTLEKGLLTVHANNSNLSQIMGQIAAAGPMIIDGEVGSSRVYGVYGPAVPSAVITRLLEGAGYNLLMVGVGPKGTPLKLVLTRKAGSATPPTQTSVANAVPENPESVGSDGAPLGPGAIANTPPPPPEDPEVRLKQRLHRLQQMQDQQNEPQLPK
jgi:hypothetical protein